MGKTDDGKYAESVLRLDIWTGQTDRNAALRAGAPMSAGAIERGLDELRRIGYITGNHNSYTITDAGRAAREALLAQ